MSNIDISLDMGMGALKLYGPGGGVQMPTQVAQAVKKTVGQIAGLSRQRRPIHIECADGSFYTGAGAHDWGRPIESLDFDRLTSPEMRAMIYATLTLCMKNTPLDAPINLTCGLPIQVMGDDASVGAIVRNFLKGEHHWRADGHDHSAVVDKVKIAPQAVGALFDYLIPEDEIDLQRAEIAKGEVGIISCGFNTVELMATRNMALIQRFTNGSTSGVRRLLELLNPQNLYSLGEMDAMLRANNLPYAAAIPTWMREVQGSVNNVWGDSWQRFNLVLIVGGGALLLGKSRLESMFPGKVHVPDDPVLSIARGLYKLAKQQVQRKS